MGNNRAADTCHNTGRRRGVKDILHLSQSGAWPLGTASRTKPRKCNMLVIFVYFKALDILLHDKTKSASAPAGANEALHPSRHCVHYWNITKFLFCFARGKIMAPFVSPKRGKRKKHARHVEPDEC